MPIANPKSIEPFYVQKVLFYVNYSVLPGGFFF